MFPGLLLLLSIVSVNPCRGQDCLYNILHNALYSSSDDIINGKKWINEKRYSGSPLLMEKYWPEADIDYKGSHYSGQLMNYDVFKGEIIIYHAEKGREKYVLLSNDNLSGFSFTDTITARKHFFIYTELPGTKGKALYENASSGLFIKPVKKVEVRSSGRSNGQFTSYYEYYLKTGDGFARFSSEGQLIKLLPDHNAGLKRYIRGNRIKINNQNPEGVINVIQYYNAIK